MGSLKLPEGLVIKSEVLQRSRAQHQRKGEIEHILIDLRPVH